MSQSARAEFAVDPNRLYFDAATYGLPPRSAMIAYRSAIDDWEKGTASFMSGWEAAGDACRVLFASLIGAPTETICLLPSVSAGVGTVAASLPTGSRVLAAEDEFPSLLLPFAAANAINGCEISTVAWEELIPSISSAFDVVIVSLTRAQDGRTIDLGALLTAATSANLRVIIDATHALPFVPVSEHLGSIDYLISHAYKHLLSPRGTAFAYINPRFLQHLIPVNANWRSAQRSYGLPLGPTETARAFDISLAWHAWAGTQPALERLLAWQEDGTLDEARSLARRLATALEVPYGGASLVCIPVADPEAVQAELDKKGLRAAGRGTNLRLSTHVWNTRDEVDRAVEIIHRTI